MCLYTCRSLDIGWGRGAWGRRDPSSQPFSGGKFFFPCKIGKHQNLYLLITCKPSVYLLLPTTRLKFVFLINAFVKTNSNLMFGSF